MPLHCKANTRHFVFVLKIRSADIGNWQRLSAIQVLPLPAIKHQYKFRKFT
jgi:hypothetical protein